MNVAAAGDVAEGQSPMHTRCTEKVNLQREGVSMQLEKL